MPDPALPLLRSLAQRTGCFLLAVGFAATATGRADEPARPNVLFIMVDDLNDWIDPLGSARAKTPNLDRLARRGAVFTRANCVVPACAPSRTSLLTGLTPATTGVHFNNQPIGLGRTAAAAQDLPSRFKAAGYFTAGLGKIFHHGRDQDQKAGSWSETYYRGYSASLDTQHQASAIHRVSLGGVWPDSWGWYADDWDRDDPQRMQQDTQNSIRAAGLLAQRHDRPFFLAVGFFRPHSKWYVAKRYYDLYPEDSIPLPEGYRERDLDDVSEAGRWLARVNVTPDTHRTLVERGLWRSAMQAYLASITYTDEQIGRVLDALEAGPNAANTIVVMCSDHGYHLGEKEHWNKFTLWERSTRVPLIVVPPGGAGGRTIGTPVSLLDIYPTLLDLAGLAAPATHRLEGISLRPLIEGRTRDRGAPVVTFQGRGNHSVRDERWRYIHYRNGEEELYDHDTDPHEWHNLAGEAKLRPVMDALARHLPANEVENAPFQEGRAVEWLDPVVFGPQ